MNEKEVLELKKEIERKKKKEINIIETHTSWVLLTGKYAYKIKKPVNFGFLNYTTLSLRYKYCQLELKLNRRFSREIYLKILPISKDKNRINFGKKGQIIDYAIKMKELPQERIMTNLLLKNQINYSIIKNLAETLGSFHNSIKPDNEGFLYGSLEIIRYNWDENFYQTKEFINKIISEKQYNFIKKEIERFIFEKENIFIERIKKGKIRYCHGDLHSQNIFVCDKIYLFDGIEFNKRFAICDLISEIAFMIMDLEFYERKDFSDYFLDNYLKITNDFFGLSLLTFYKTYRAYVRGKVTGFLYLQNKEEKILEKTKRYFDLAARYANNLFKARKFLIFFGHIGTGKSFLAQEFGKRNETIVLNTDIIRKELANLPLEEERKIIYGKDIYSYSFSKKTYNYLIKRGLRYYLNNYSVILDGTFNKKEWREMVKKILNKKVSPFWVYIHANEKIIKRRLSKKRLITNGRLEIYHRMKKDFYPIKNLKNLIKIDNSKDYKKAIKNLEQKLFCF
ncbi:MAG: AAA family ATPase [candidate division WOR-3 bacterium]|nr:AAA family ATPase [candidate division WOR-3 bacterium]MDW8114022.1 AAA family ATPase [candidate division WOR-3 bacterium]